MTPLKSDTLVVTVKATTLDLAVTAEGPIAGALLERGFILVSVVTKTEPGVRTVEMTFNVPQEGIQ